MNVTRLANGNLLVPMRAEDDSGVIGDGMVEVQPGTPEAAEWEAWAALHPSDVHAEAPDSGPASSQDT